MTLPADAPRPRAPEALVSTAWLAAHLGDADLRIHDCTSHLLPAPHGSLQPYEVRSGRAEYDQGHIPGAGFIDIQGELSDTTTTLRFMMPGPSQFARVMAEKGIGRGTRAVLYSAGQITWATRVWWMLRAYGFDNVAVLDGGFDKWKAEGRPLSTTPCRYPRAVFIPEARPGLIVGKEQVRDAIGAPRTVTLNALSPQLHKGEGESRYGRPGRVPGSVNVPAATLVDPAAKTFVPLADAAARFRAAGVVPEKRVIAYCGGGISATVDLFLLHQLGFDDLTLYDASMGEWARDASLPIETG
jgi:thiosulfate/3-mercaptopyruvate sulfurtransferase